MVSILLKNGKNLFLRRQTSILSAAAVIMAAYAASGFLGLIRNRFLAQHFFSGREHQLDAYFAAFVLPDSIFQLMILGALSAAFIPVFTEYLRRDRDEAWQVASSSMTAILLLFIVISSILFLFAVPAARILAPNFSPELVQLTAQLIRIMLFAQFFFALSSFLTGILQSHHHFLLPAIAPIFYNLGIIAGIILLSPLVGIYGPAIGVVIGSFLHFLIQLPFALRLGFKFQLSTNFFHPGVKRIRKLMPARAVTLAMSQLERIIAVMISSSLAAGTITIFNFARQLYVLPISLFGATIGQASFPTLSHAHHDGQDKFVTTAAAVILQSLFFVLPAAALLLVLRIPAVRLSFGAKQFPWEATLLTGRSVAIFAISVPAQALNQIFIRTFYAAQNTKLPLVAAGLSTGLLVVLTPTLALGLGWGILGVVGAIAIADITNMFLLIGLLERTIASGLVKLIAAAAGKIILATLITGTLLWTALRLFDQFVFDTTRTMPLIGLTSVVSISGIIVYLLLAKLMKIEQLGSVARLCNRLGNWRQILSESEEVLEPTPSQ